MLENRPARKALSWEPERKRRHGRPRATWKDTAMREVQRMDISWDDIIDTADSRRVDRGEKRT